MHSSVLEISTQLHFWLPFCGLCGRHKEGTQEHATFSVFRSRFGARLKLVCLGLTVERKPYLSEKTAGLMVLFKVLVVLEDQKVNHRETFSTSIRAQPC